MVDYRVVEKAGKTYIECLPGPEILDSEQAALDLVGACDGSGTRLLLIPAGTLSPDFLNLRTRLAGDILLKFTNYRIIAAAVLTPEQVGSGRFSEFAMETNRGRDFRIFPDHDSAEQWLLTNPQV